MPESHCTSATAALCDFSRVDMQMAACIRCLLLGDEAPLPSSGSISCAQIAPFTSESPMSDSLKCS